MWFGGSVAEGVKFHKYFDLISPEMLALVLMAVSNDFEQCTIFHYICMFRSKTVAGQSHCSPLPIFLHIIRISSKLFTSNIK